MHWIALITLSKSSLQLRSDKNSILPRSLYHVLQHSNERMSYSDSIIFPGCLLERCMRYTRQRNKSFYRCIACSSHLPGMHMLSQKKTFLHIVFSVNSFTCSKVDSSRIINISLPVNSEVTFCNNIRSSFSTFVSWVCSSFPMLPILIGVNWHGCPAINESTKKYIAG